MALFIRCSVSRPKTKGMVAIARIKAAEKSRILRMKRVLIDDGITC
jgi:hypothetical protein